MPCCLQGSDSILPFVTKRKVKVTAEDLGKILQYDDIELPCEFKNLDAGTQQRMAESGEWRVNWNFTGLRVASGLNAQWLKFVHA